MLTHRQGTVLAVPLACCFHPPASASLDPGPVYPVGLYCGASRNSPVQCTRALPRINDRNIPIISLFCLLQHSVMGIGVHTVT